jgi:hypothetical protein
MYQLLPKRESCSPRIGSGGLDRQLSLLAADEHFQGLTQRGRWPRLILFSWREQRVQQDREIWRELIWWKK